MGTATCVGRAPRPISKRTFVFVLTWVMAAIPDLFSSQSKVPGSGDQEPLSVYVNNQTMSGSTEDTFYSEPFTLISSTAETLGVTAASQAHSKSFFGHVTAGKDWLASKHSKVQSWSEFFNLRNISRPSGAGELTSRILGNVQRFQTNYLFIFLGLLVYCIVSNPTLLLALGFCFGSWWFIAIRNNSENLRLFGRDTSAKELYLVVTLVSIPLFYFAGAGSAVFWIIGASVVLILAHAGAMASPRRTVDEELGLVMEEVSIS